MEQHRYSRWLYHFLPPQGESSNCVFSQGILGGDPGEWVMASRSPSCHLFTSRLFHHAEPIWTPRLVEIKSVLFGDPWESRSTVYKLYFSFPGGNWELGFFISSLCFGKERRYGISDHRLLSPFLFQAARLWWTHLSSETGRTEVSSPVSLVGKVGSLDVQTDPSLLW